MKIAIDAMGGDFAPTNIVGGVEQALRAYPAIRKLLLTGDEAIIREELDAHGVSDRRIEIVHASEVVGMGDKAIDAVRRKKDSSISVAVDLVKRGEAQAVVSVGNTGAAVAAATIKLRNLAGVDRAGIASPLPNEHGICNIMDAGANVDAKPLHLFQYAIMGHVYAKHVLRREKPIIGLMSVGGEEGKGTGCTRQVFEMLKATDLNFLGNVEGHDLFETPVDVVVCDGFTGNIILKSCEATAKFMFKLLKFEIRSSPLRKLGALMAKGAFRETMRRSNYESYGGSPLLGVNGICIIGHGSSSALAVKNAIRVAAESISHEVNPHIEEEIAKHAAAAALA